MRIVSLLLIILLSCPEVLRAENSETQKILEELDAVIVKKDIYQARKEATIEGLERRLERVDSISEKLALFNELFHEYLHYQADSAMSSSMLGGSALVSTAGAVWPRSSRRSAIRSASSAASGCLRLTP